MFLNPGGTASPRSRSRLHSVTAARFFLFAMVTLCLLSSPSLAAESGKVAIRVNGETVSVQEFNHRVETQLKRMGDKSDGQKKISPQKRRQIEGRVIDQLVLKLVLQSQVKKERIEVREEEVQKSWQQMVDRYGSEAKLRQKLDEIGKTPDEFRRDLALSIKFRKFVEKRTSEVEVSDEEARNYMRRNREKFGDKSFEQVKQRIKRTLKGKKQQKAVGNMLRTLRKKADVEVNV